MLLKQKTPPNKGAGCKVSFGETVKPVSSATAAAFKILATLGEFKPVFRAPESNGKPAPVNRKSAGPKPAPSKPVAKTEAAKILAYIECNLAYDEAIERYRWKNGYGMRRAGDIADGSRAGLRIGRRTYTTARIRFVECNGRLPKGREIAAAGKRGLPLPKPRKDTNTGVLGVGWDNRRQKFIVQVPGHRHLGRYDDFDEAARVAGTARRKTYGIKLDPRPELPGAYRRPLPNTDTVRAQIRYALSWDGDIRRYRWKTARPKVRIGAIAGCEPWGMIGFFRHQYSTKKLRFLELNGHWPSPAELREWVTQ